MWVLSLLGVEVAGLPLVELVVDIFWHVSDPNWHVGLEVGLQCLVDSLLSLFGGFSYLVLLSSPFFSLLGMVVFLGKEAATFWFLHQCSVGFLSAPGGECFSWC